MSGPVFDVDEVFDEDYLYFYEPRLEEVSDAEAELICRLLELERGMDVIISPAVTVASRIGSVAAAHA